MRTSKTYTVTISAIEMLLIWMNRTGHTRQRLCRIIGVGGETLRDIIDGKIEFNPVALGYLEKAGYSYTTDRQELQAHEFLWLIMHRKKMKQKDLEGIHPTRVSPILNGQIWPGDREQAVIYKLFPKMKGAWK